IDPNLEAPRTEEVTAGIRIEHGPVSFRFAGEHRSATRLVETSNVGAPLTSYRIRYVGDPGADIAGTEDDQLLAVYDRLVSSFGQDRYLLLNPSDHGVVQEGVELAFDLRPGEHWLLRLGGTASKTTGAGANRGFRASENDPGVPGELYDDPNA